MRKDRGKREKCAGENESLRENVKRRENRRQVENEVDRVKPKELG